MWQPIETAPKDGSDIVIRCNSNNSPMFAIANWDDDPTSFADGKPGWMLWWVSENGFPVRADWATHWMPLPNLAAA